jgi:hypothetical protein
MLMDAPGLRKLPMQGDHSLSFGQVAQPEMVEGKMKADQHPKMDVGAV